MDDVKSVTKVTSASEECQFKKLRIKNDLYTTTTMTVEVFLQFL